MHHPHRPVNSKVTKNPRPTKRPGVALSNKFGTISITPSNSPYELEFVSIDLNRGAVLSGSDSNIKNLKWEATFKIKLLSFIE